MAADGAALPPRRGPQFRGSGYAYELPERFEFAREEERVQELWDQLDAFKQQLELSRGNPEYTFYDGPPFATGLPHYGHILAGTIKDTVTRYATQTGHYVSRRFGWDCHGLPVEHEIDKRENIGSVDDVMALENGIATYNSMCRGIVTRYCSEWEKIVTRLGRWIDFRHDYKTMEPWYMESVWWVFQQLWQKDYVYRGFKVMPYSTACTTPLSNFESGLNYKEITDPAIVVSFPLRSDPSTAFVAWTTTPWTLPSNLALCVHPELPYVKVRDSKTGAQYILAKSRLPQLYPKMEKKGYKGGEYEVLDTMPGASLVGLTYEPLFDYFWDSHQETAFRVVSDGYVTDDAGTGLVHQAPAFGEDDYRVCVGYGVIAKNERVPCPVDDNGKFVHPVTDFEGQYVKDADAAICAALKERSRMVQKANIVHSYPFCWRSDTPLIYRAVPSWFVAVEQFKDRLLKNNEGTYWVPNSVKDGRFHNWLRDARDWAVSRNRYWGTPLPIWVSDDGEEIVVIGSIAELEEKSGATVTDLHRESIDHLTIPSALGKGPLRRVPEVFDCWFESGSMPYAQVHYPFDMSEEEFLEKKFPADFIAEGLDQTRGWFYTLMVLSTALFDRPAFRNLVVNGLVLAEDGKKMSKRHKNYPDPVHVINSHGADALRLYLINSPVVRAETLRFSEAGVEGVVKEVLLKWYNAFRFFSLAVVQWEEESKPAGASTGRSVAFVARPDLAKESRNEMDHWIMAATQSLIQFVRSEMGAYRLFTVVPRLLEFIQELTNWYIKLNRTRLLGFENHDEAHVALSVLYEVLATLCRLMGPFTPFFAEYTYQRLRGMHPDSESFETLPRTHFGAADSVHFVSLPEYDASLLDPEMERRVAALQTVVNLARVCRERRMIPFKTPIRSVLVVHRDPSVLERVRSLEGYIKGELNTMELHTSTEEDEYCTLLAKADGRVLGPKLGKDFKRVLAGVAALKPEEVRQVLETGRVTVAGHELTEGIHVLREFRGDTDKYEAEVASDGSLLVAIDCTMDETLRTMGIARDIASHVQKLRKKAGLFRTDVVNVTVNVRAATEEETHAQDIRERFHAKPAVSPDSAGAVAGAGAGGAATASGGPASAGAGKEKGKGKPKGKKGAKASVPPAQAASAPPAEAPALSPAEARARVRRALALHRELTENKLRLALLPDCDATRPTYAAVLAREAFPLEKDVVVELRLVRPCLLPGEPARWEAQAPRDYQGSFARDVMNLLATLSPQSVGADGAIHTTLNSARIDLRQGADFFTNGLEQLRKCESVQQQWREAGFADLADAYLA